MTYRVALKSIGHKLILLDWALWMLLASVVDLVVALVLLPFGLLFPTNLSVLPFSGYAKALQAFTRDLEVEADKLEDLEVVKLGKEEREIVQYELRQLAARVGADLETIEAIATDMVEEEKQG